MSTSEQQAVDAGLLPLPAGTSTVGLLARQVIVGRDPGAILPLLDALQDAGQLEERRQVVGCVGGLLGKGSVYDSMIGSGHPLPQSHAQRLHGRWCNFVSVLTHVLFADLYDLAGSLADLADQFAANPYTPPEAKTTGFTRAMDEFTRRGGADGLWRWTMPINDDGMIVDGVQLGPLLDDSEQQAE